MAHELSNLWVALRIQCGLEHRHKDIVEHVLEASELAGGTVDGVQPRDLDHPSLVRRDQLVVKHPLCQLLPLVPLSAVDAEAPLGVLVLGLLEVVEELLCDLPQIAAVHLVVYLEEDGPKVWLVHWVVLLVESVKAVEDRVVRRDVQVVQAEVGGRRADLAEDLVQCHRLALSPDNNVITVVLGLLLDKAQQMLRIHGRTVVNVCVDLPHIVEVAVGHGHLFLNLQIEVCHHVEVKLGLQQPQPLEAESAD
mmetsp:Transcript_58715/g.157290  ORF Transcript_58715/g.157290 Transcript_58715/m.157290 type:complete len:251 (+) Transcript_58715:1320-2072(+)